MESSADLPYAEKVDGLGARLWPLVKNTFEDIDMTSAVLNDPEARDNIIRQILTYSQLYGFDGVNMDFENIYLKDRDAYTQLIREIMPYAREAGLTVSVDVGIPGGSDTYSLCYDHAKLSKIADYIMVMTYDQHWGSSRVAGSQAQLSWVRDMVELTLEYMDSDKLVLGLPFYTRIWREGEDGARNVMTTGIDRTFEIVEEKNAEVSWDEESGQYYASYEDENGLHRMWIEESESLALKAALVKEYGLKGVAAWQLSLGNGEAWQSIGEVLNERDE
jgi:spore germination protein YaaH